MTPEYKITIATADKRTSTNWLTRETTWQSLIELCRHPKRTAESVAQYFAMTKDERSAVKDVGGFVGGALRGRRRKKDKVAARDLLTLDLDHALPDFWERFQRIFRGTAAFIYSTHSHTPEAPRLRLIIPLSRSIQPEAYEPIARSIAYDLGMEQFDDTTYDASRLMYFPSCPADGEYIFEEQDGQPIDPDAVLSGYDDWLDTEEWPVSSRESKRVITGVRKAEDPLSKEGIVGDFCRIYSVQDAIEKFLPEIYGPGTDRNRYTYLAGTTSNGLVIYEGKFAHAFQSTDPLCGPHSYNAFDLVRLHLFGSADKERDLELPVTERPSYKKMLNFIYTDKDFQQSMLARQLEDAKADFADVPSEEEAAAEDAKTWRTQLEVTKEGKLKPSQKNFIVLLDNLPEFKGHLWYDDFEYRIKVHGNLPWDKAHNDDRPLSSEDYSQINTYFVLHYGFGLSRVNLLDSVVTVAKRHARHPVREYLEQLRWDGVARLDTLFIDFLAAPDDPLIRAMTRKHLVAAIKRIYRPGCQYDQVIIFTGDQGAGKSTIIRRLGGAWAKPLSSSFTGKESAEQLSGGWLFESGELRGWRGADIESIKDFFTRTSDHYRPAYGMTVNDYPRRCVFFATTNDVIFLNDPTGNRRFWPIPVRKGKAQFDIWRDFTDHYRDQIWAEALHYYREGEDTFLHPEQEEQLHNFQGRFTDTFFEDLTATIEEFLDTPLPQDWYARNKSRRVSYFRFDAGDDMIANMRRDKVCLEEIRAECLQGGKFNNRTITTNDLKQAIAKLPKWVEAPSTLRFGTGYGRHRGYTRYLDPLEDPDSDIL